MAKLTLKGMTPTQHEKKEWGRMAEAAYAQGGTATGHRFSAAAALPNGGSISVNEFDALQEAYREWLVFDKLPEENGDVDTHTSGE